MQVDSSVNALARRAVSNWRRRYVYRASDLRCRFVQYMDEALLKHASVAQVGGVPSITHRLRAFIKYLRFQEEHGLDRPSLGGKERWTRKTSNTLIDCERLTNLDFCIFSLPEWLCQLGARVCKREQGYVWHCPRIYKLFWGIHGQSKQTVSSVYVGK